MNRGRQVWMGLETEHAVTFLAADGSAGCAPETAAGEVMATARARLRHVPCESGRGIYLANGSRLYLDGGSSHWHLELATAEVPSPLALVRLRHETERALAAVTRQAAAAAGHSHGSISYASYCYAKQVAMGSHENYSLGQPAAPGIIPFLASRVVLCGCGGLDPLSPGITFVLSPRALFTTVAASRHTEFCRGIIDLLNITAARPTGSRKRLHLHCADGNRSDISLLLRFGTMAAVGAALEAGASPPLDRIGIPKNAAVAAMHAFATDPTCRATAPTVGGPQTACAIQRAYLTMVRDVQHRLPEWVPSICQLWDETCSMLESDPQLLATRLDWCIKKRMFDHLVARGNLDWPHVGQLNGAVERLEQLLREQVRPNFRLDSRSLADLPAGQLRDAWQQVGHHPDGAADASAVLGPVLDLRERLAALDLRYMMLGDESDSLFFQLARAGHIDAQAAGAGVAPLGSDPLDLPLPPSGRARTRARLVAAFGGMGPDLPRGCSCSWQRFKGADGFDLSMPDVARELPVPILDEPIGQSSP